MANMRSRKQGTTVDVTGLDYSKLIASLPADERLRLANQLAEAAGGRAVVITSPFNRVEDWQGKAMFRFADTGQGSGKAIQTSAARWLKVLDELESHYEELVAAAGQDAPENHAAPRQARRGR